MAMRRFFGFKKSASKEPAAKLVFTNGQQEDSSPRTAKAIDNGSPVSGANAENDSIHSLVTKGDVDYYPTRPTFLPKAYKDKSGNPGAGLKGSVKQELVWNTVSAEAKRDTVSTYEAVPVSTTEPRSCFVSELKSAKENISEICQAVKIRSNGRRRYGLARTDC